MPTTIVACVDGSVYIDSVCQHAAWASDRLQYPIRVLHVHTPPLTYEGHADYSGAIGVGEVGSLLEKLSEVDKARGKLDMHKGDAIIGHARSVLTALGHAPLDLLHRRGSLVETLTDLEGDTQLVVLGKRGEHADFARLHLGSNLERVVRAIHQPVFVCSRAFAPISRFAIAYDGGPSSTKAIDYIMTQPLLEELECHLLTVGRNDEETNESLAASASRLRQAGFAVHTYREYGRPEQVIASYIEEHAIGLLVMGAYGHNRVRTLVVGSTTSAMLRSCRIPVLLFR